MSNTPSSHNSQQERIRKSSRKRKINDHNDTSVCENDELEYIEDRAVRKKHIIWGLFVEIAIRQNDAVMERMYCPGCKCDLAPKLSTLKSHLKAFHEEVSKAVIQQQMAEKKQEMTINEAFALVLSIPCLSLNILTHPYVRQWSNCSSKLILGTYMPKSSSALSSRLRVLSKKVHQEVVSVLSGTRYRPTLVADAWSDSSMHGYLGINLVVVDSADLVLKTFVLGVYPLIGSQTAEYLLQKAREILAEFDLDLSSIFKFVTDQGSAFVKGFGKLLSPAVSPIDNDLHDDEEEEWEDDKKAIGNSAMLLCQ
uniref:BED-type domain-containing protein n=1 Tax=Ditylenchus dipsaci TaxID=166011 RepID=A0A915DDX5_9BILA